MVALRGALFYHSSSVRITSWLIRPVVLCLSFARKIDADLRRKRLLLHFSCPKLIVDQVVWENHDSVEGKNILNFIDHMLWD